MYNVHKVHARHLLGSNRKKSILSNNIITGEDSIADFPILLFFTYF